VTAFLLGSYLSSIGPLLGAAELFGVNQSSGWGDR